MSRRRAKAAVREIIGCCPAVGSIRASMAAILARLGATPGLTPQSRANAVSRARSLLECLAVVAGDRWESVTARMLWDWCDGLYAVEASKPAPSRSPGSKKVRRSAARKVLRAAVSTGAITADSDIARCLELPSGDPQPGASDTDPERIAHAIETWQPRDADPSHAEPIIVEARKCVTVAAPASVNKAKRYLLCVFVALESGLEEFGRIDHRVVLHPVNVECFVMNPDRGWTDGWRSHVRSVLRDIGRTVCPDLWPDRPQPIAARDAVAPYDGIDEYMLHEAALMAGRKPRCERLALTGLTLGAGLSGAEAQLARTEDIVELGGDRLGVRVHRVRDRIVPIRRAYTSLVAEARDLRGEGRFFASDSNAAASSTAANIRVDGQGSLSLHRARATFVCAHIRVGTSLAVLDEIAGPISGEYLQQMLAYCDGSIDPADAAVRGLRA